MDIKLTYTAPNLSSFSEPRSKRVDKTPVSRRSGGSAISSHSSVSAAVALLTADQYVPYWNGLTDALVINTRAAVVTVPITCSPPKPCIELQSVLSLPPVGFGQSSAETLVLRNTGKRKNSSLYFHLFWR